MSTSQAVHTSSVAAAAAPAATPTTTYYQQLAEEVMKAIDDLQSKVPQFETGHLSTKAFVQAHAGIPLKFLGTVVSAVEQNPELQSIQRLDVAQARDTLQFIDAFGPVLNKVNALARGIGFTINSRRATLGADALQVYDITKGLSRDPSSAVLALHAENMKRDLGRRGPRGAKQARPAPSPSAPAGSATT